MPANYDYEIISIDLHFWIFILHKIYKGVFINLFNDIHFIHSKIWQLTMRLSALICIIEYLFCLLYAKKESVASRNRHDFTQIFYLAIANGEIEDPFINENGRATGHGLEELKSRYKIFIDNKKDINAQNKNPLNTYTSGLTTNSIKTAEEKSAMLGRAFSNASINYHQTSGRQSGNLPEHRDWRGKVEYNMLRFN